MKKSLVHRFLIGKLKSEELHRLREEINTDEEAFTDILESDWDNVDTENLQEWPARHWEELESRIMPVRAREREVSVFRLQWWMKTAAALFIVVSVWFAYRTNRSDSPADDNAPVLITRVNDSDVPQSVILADGTRVLLTAHSSISYYENFNERYRVVHLDGEAYFETDEQNTRPFIVISENITSICRGSEFSIAAHKDSDEINVTSAEGQIEIAQNDRLNSESNKIAVSSCQRYSFNKTNHQVLIGKIADCDFDEKVRSMKEAEMEKVVML